MGDRLQGKVAVITGGTSGMGRGTVELFLHEGAKVVVADILDDKGAQMEKDFGANLAYHHTDVAEEADVKGAVDLAVSKFGRLDCIFNNAGIGGVSGEIQEITMEGFDKTVGVLLKGVVLGMKYAAPVMKAQKSGSIISTASVAGLSGGFGPHIYSACKAAVVHLSKSVALELGKYNVRVNAICPGGIATSIFGRGLGLPSQLADESAKKMEEVLVNFQPIRRSGLPSDIARMALFLASDDSTFVSGQAIAVDGALMAGRERSQGAARIGEGMAKAFGDLMKT
ncbi:MAG TPA: 2,5-dichloro-2,5-cyclohexadiene-1,4-diol dehydrogenase [Alphaproteobacteria bacterium]|jgi:NAD(P)-dependent dehydrogenase (short-subunit alcohol dehydrogenase family)|nr:2,5-dichloro-2,5-cyclohexadiene-1,4-diol dehydrogenase [Alphaproteobacteria bacterium]